MTSVFTGISKTVFSRFQERRNSLVVCVGSNDTNCGVCAIESTKEELAIAMSVNKGECTFKRILS